MKPDVEEVPCSLSHLNLNLFRVFEAVYRERSLTRAAELLHTSQPAVSHSLSRLREQFDDALFVREAQGVTPTPLAERIWPDIREALGLMRQTLIRSRQFDPERDISRITLAMINETEPLVLPLLLQNLERRLPQLVICSVRLDRSTLRADLAAGRIDLAIDVAQPSDPDICHRFLHADRFIVLSRSDRPVSRGDYLNARHITVSSRRSGRSVEDIVLARQGIERHIAVRCQHYAAACRLVSCSDLLLTLPRIPALAANLGLNNAIHPLPLEMPSVALHMFWHKDRDDDPASQWLRRTLRESAQQAEEQV